MSGDEPFLSRWARRKQEARAAATNAASPPQTEARGASAPAPVPPEEEPALTPEELAALPPIESITAETDLAAFMRRGVPAVLRTAALRKMWSVDPTIRDYVGDARDYGYDWNVPGGVPGFSPLDPASDVQATVERVLGDKNQDARETAPEPGEDESQAVSVQQDGGAGEETAGPVDHAERSTEPSLELGENASADKTASEAVTRVPHRRHGRARPS